MLAHILSLSLRLRLALAAAALGLALGLALYLALPLAVRLVIGGDLGLLGNVIGERRGGLLGGFVLVGAALRGLVRRFGWVL